MTTKVVRLAHREDNPMAYDRVFFPKEAIRLGTRLLNVGRRDPNSIWIVTEIRTYVRRGDGFYYLMPTDTLLHLSDIVTLERETKAAEFSSRREPTFGSLSYSAIWRLA